MEAPPFDLLEKKTKENPFKCIKKFHWNTTKYEELKYNVELSILENENQLIIVAKPKNIFQIYYYMGLFILDDIIKLNNFFKLYSNIKKKRLEI